MNAKETRISLRLSRPERDALFEAAERAGTTVSEFVRWKLEQVFESRARVA